MTIILGNYADFLLKKVFMDFGFKLRDRVILDPTVGIRIVSEYWARPFKDQTGFKWFILKETRCSLLLQSGGGGFGFDLNFGP